MPRTKRVEYEGAYYHVMVRGNRGSNMVVELEGLRENDWRKVCIALEIRRDTTMNGDWISKRLKVGSGVVRRVF